MLLGTFETNLMEKGRLTLPKKIREELSGEKVVLTVGFEECIFGFAEKMWEEITKSELSRPLFSDRESRDLRRRMCAEAINIELDEQGRFLIPVKMMEFVSLKAKVVVVGAGDHFEIWDKAIWEEYHEGLRGGK